MKFSNLAITTIIFFSFLIPFSALYLMDEFVDGFSETKNEVAVLENNISDSQKTKIFLIGSSRMMMLDAVYIDEYILKNGKEVNVYNQGLSSDIPTRRLTVLDEMISLKPEYAFIGVDIYNYFQTGNYKSSSPNSFSASYRCSNKLPEIQQIINQIIPYQKQVFGIDLSNFDNPKLTTLKLLSKVFPDSFKQTNEDMPPDDFFASIKSLTKKQSWAFDTPSWRNLADDERIKWNLETSKLIEGYSRIFNPDNSQAKALREIIETLQDNNIKVVLFTTILHRTTYDAAYPCGIQGFEAFMEKLSQEYNVNWYSFHDKYLDHNIWRDAQHIVWGEKGLVYSEDVAKMIFQELQ